MKTSIATCASILAVAFLATPAAAQWSQEQPLTATGGDVWGEGVAAAGTTLHFVYGTGVLQYRRSVDEGATWSTPFTVGTGTLHLTDPIVADGNDVWIVYLDDMKNVSDWCCPRDVGNIYLRHSGDGGVSWEAPKKLTTGQGAFRVSLAYAADRLHLVWMDYRGGKWDTYYLRSKNRGASWDPETVIGPSAGVFGAERPQVAARGASVHVTIWDDRGNNPSCTLGNTSFSKCPDVFHVRSTDGGDSFGPITNVAMGGAKFAGRNDIAVSGNSDVVINYNVSVDGEVGSKLFAIASHDDGATWDAPTRLTFSPNESDHGSIIGYGAGTHLAWHDDRNPGNREIYYRFSPDGGLSWDAEEQVSSGAPGDSTTPLDAVTPNYVHVIWLDNLGGNYQVRYRRRELQSTGPVGTGGAGGSGVGGSGVGGSGAGGSGAGAGGSGSTSGAGGSGGISGSSTGAGTGGSNGGGGASANGAKPGATEGGCSCRMDAGDDSAWGAVAMASLMTVFLSRRRRSERAGSARSSLRATPRSLPSR